MVVERVHMLVALPGKLVHKHLNMHLELREERARVVAPDTHLHELFEEPIDLTVSHLFCFKKLLKTVI